MRQEDDASAGTNYNQFNGRLRKASKGVNQPLALVQKTRKLVREERKRREISAKKNNNEVMTP